MIFFLGWKKKLVLIFFSPIYDINKGRVCEKSVIVGYFLDYFCNNAVEHIGWMVTVSRALPSLYGRDLEHYVDSLLYKECFTKYLDNYAIVDLISQEKLSKLQKDKFKAFEHDTKLNQKKAECKFAPKQFLIKQFKKLKRFIINDSDKSTPPPVTLRVVPLPNFALNDFPTQRLQQMIDDINSSNMLYPVVFLKDVLKHIFIPRDYQVKNTEKLSPFTQIIKSTQNLVIYDNPAMKAIIEVMWKHARSHFLHAFFMFALYAIIYSLLCLEHTAKLDINSYVL